MQVGSAWLAIFVGKQAMAMATFCLVRCLPLLVAHQASKDKGTAMLCDEVKNKAGTSRNGRYKYQENEEKVRSYRQCSHGCATSYNISPVGSAN
jgi:hypothetical protein